MMRLFIALPLPGDVEQRLEEIIAELRRQSGRVKWVESKNIHLTMRFLGNTEESQVGDLSRLVGSVAGQYPPVTTVLDRLGGFPNLSRPRVLWVGFRDNVEFLEKMARQIELGVRALRFPKEKKGFKPHLTIGRVKDVSTVRGLSEYMKGYELAEIPVTFDRLVLFKSTLTPQGPIYDRLHEAELGRRSG